ncbi:hypothetical protein B0H17DRAFT_1196242 [Mycena rosella]|uniref:Uncharacterized protein n=1 Tax=Mycena rosella TaxID=1033263 RepID=A0AAD7GNR3_MYCRO|nr:hypothetical protein B0H17DRAFT_1196242 [Mycena rosella]
MSQIPQVSVEENIALELPAWLVSADARYVIDHEDWNTEATSADKQRYTHYSVKWDEFYDLALLQREYYDIEVFGLVVHHYFDVGGPGFSSVAAFHLHYRSTTSTEIPAAAGGKEEVIFDVFSFCPKPVPKLAALD